MRFTLTTTVPLLAVLCGTPAMADQTILYPTTAKPAFSIVAPDAWTLDPAEEAGGFFTLTGPTGAQLSFRTVDASEESMKDAVKETVDWVKENYKNVQLGDAKDAVENGLKGFNAVGTGNDKTDGHPVVFVMEWLELGKKGIAEIWFCVDKNDKKGTDEAGKVAGSIKAR